MIKVNVKPEWVKQAEKEAVELGELNNSITHGEGNVAGKIGELAFNDFVGGVLAPTRDYDVVWDNYTFDVKTKRCTSAPRRDFNCSVADYNTKQNCDFYAFVRVLGNNSVAWILGFIEKKKFYQKARFFRKGEIDPDDARGFDFKADCYNVRIRELIEFNEEKINLAATVGTTSPPVPKWGNPVWSI